MSAAVIISSIRVNSICLLAASVKCFSSGADDSQWEEITTWVYYGWKLDRNAGKVYNLLCVPDQYPYFCFCGEIRKLSILFGRRKCNTCMHACMHTHAQRERERERGARRERGRERVQYNRIWKVNKKALSRLQRWATCRISSSQC